MVLYSSEVKIFYCAAFPSFTRKVTQSENKISMAGSIFDNAMLTSSYSGIVFKVLAEPLISPGIDLRRTDLKFPIYFCSF